MAAIFIINWILENKNARKFVLEFIKEFSVTFPLVVVLEILTARGSIPRYLEFSLKHWSSYTSVSITGCFSNLRTFILSIDDYDFFVFSPILDVLMKSLHYAQGNPRKVISSRDLALGMLTASKKTIAGEIFRAFGITEERIMELGLSQQDALSGSEEDEEEEDTPRYLLGVLVDSHTRRILSSAKSVAYNSGRAQVSSLHLLHAIFESRSSGARALLLKEIPLRDEFTRFMEKVTETGVLGPAYVYTDFVASGEGYRKASVISVSCGYRVIPKKSRGTLFWRLCWAFGMASVGVFCVGATACYRSEVKRQAPPPARRRKRLLIGTSSSTTRIDIRLPEVSIPRFGYRYTTETYPMNMRTDEAVYIEHRGEEPQMLEKRTTFKPIAWRTPKKIFYRYTQRVSYRCTLTYRSPSRLYRMHLAQDPLSPAEPPN